MTRFSWRQKLHDSGGFTLVELVISITVFSVVALSMIGLFVTLVHSAIIAKRKAVASTLATNQMEYLKSLPYDSLAVAGGDIYTTNPLPATTTSTINGVKYTIKTSISYVDDAFDGCGSYPNQTLKQLYCRNYPPPSGSPAIDSNPQDYKIIDVSVTDPTGSQLALVDTQIAARVAETASTTGALFVKVIDANGNPVSGATVNIVNNSLSPVLNLTDSTDSNGVSIFYGMPPDTTNYHYNITASQTGYSTLTTIAPSGSLQPNYSNQNILTQQSSFVTLTIKQQGSNSLVIETTDTSGNPLTGIKVYVKGGYKKYTASSDTTYYYDNMSPTDTRPTTDSSGLTSLFNLVPGTYIFCGDLGATNCKIGNTTYYLAAAVPYGGTNALNPITVPTFDPANPPATTYAYGGLNYLQEVRLMLTTNSSFPRVSTLTPSEASQGSGLSSFSFQITGVNLPCTSSPGSCNTSVSFLQGSSTYTASCTGTSGGTQLTCTVNLSAAGLGGSQLIVATGGNTLTLPAAPLLGGVNVVP